MKQTELLHQLLRRIAKLEKNQKALQKQVVKLEKDNDRLKKWALRERKKMNACEWLNEHYSPTEDFNTWSKTLIVEERDMQYFFNNGFVKGVFQIILKRLPLENRRSYPIVAFKHSRISYFYIYNKERWSKMPDNALVTLFLQKINPHMYRAQTRWEKENPCSIGDNKKISQMRFVKIAIDPDCLSKKMNQVKGLLSDYLKLNLKNIVEYEFVF